MSSLSSPASPALVHSQQLADLIHAEITSCGGWISFARFMELALYAPGFGYYSAGLEKFGEAGDFVTAPEISPLFGRTLARQIAQVLAEAGGDILELGAGSGKLAVDVLLELGRLDCLPEHYFILEVSADLRQRQQQAAQSLPTHLAQKIVWLDALPETFSGAILGNEVLDALPVHMVAWREDGIYERGVVLAGEALAWGEQPCGSAALGAVEALGVTSKPYLSEINLAAPALIASLAQGLQKGAILLVDYGFPRREYYHPQRDSGTLMCHTRHQAHADPLLNIGLQDITAHVDFTAVADAAEASGMALLGYTTQAQFLINCGITDLLAEISPEDVAAYMPQVAAVQKLLSPAEMGELFKVIALGKSINTPLMGFAQGDQGFRL